MRDEKKKQTRNCSPNQRSSWRMLSLALLMLLGTVAGCEEEDAAPPSDDEGQTMRVRLPDPSYDSGSSLELLLRQRRSVRSFADLPLTIEQVAQLLWSAQGITEPTRGLRTAPSAGATYPLETYLVVRSVETLDPGVYRYDPARHALTRVIEADVSAQLADAALSQESISEAAISIIFTAVYERTRRYGPKTERFVHMEIGHASQNVFLQATALDLGCVVIGAFHEDQVSSLLRLPRREAPLYIQPIGVRK